MTARGRMAGGWALRVVVLGLLAAGCGDDAPVAEPTDTERETSGGETTRPRGEQPQITGLMGTIQREQVERAMRPRLSRLQRCFAARMGDVELLAGDIRLEFRIRTDGSVLWVYPQQSTIGDRATEQCILEVASQVRFSRPRGGEAEFSWGFGLESGAERLPDVVRDIGRSGCCDCDDEYAS